MSETLSVTMSETSRVVKRDLAVMQKVGILRMKIRVMSVFVVYLLNWHFDRLK